MVHVLPAANRPPGTSRTIRFEGEAYGTPVSFFAVDVAPGHGPVLHRHPYAETWIVLRGRAEVVAGDRVFPSAQGMWPWCRRRRRTNSPRSGTSGWK
ncbi:cupin domain-containing protein [Devosia sp. SD17-2]|jgi:mannose-6-phosphate isomerase-like protein (cupin superfamily)|uniref:cupin domain-containing protein n=1 Tax=Devosia sp. SD17-2 TaxID=2976459 RepID=UPI0023D8240F|nr:cupin domain-containing protein [Devosia sp. SD17-2]WEJ32628.1 hypothetical protein NYQ88_17335 [Devosia sp. SD17-2]